MTDDGKSKARYSLPGGYVAVAASADQVDAPLRVCAVVRSQPDPAGGRLVVLRNTVEARVLLGCLLDAGGKVHQWLELWVQDPGGLTDTTAVCKQALANPVLDARWARHAVALEAVDAGLIRTGWETEHPLPTFLDLAAGRPVHPRDAESGDHWSLCRDDAVLAQCGLPAYSTSVFRYLYLPALAADSPFVPASPDAPTTDRCESMATVAGGADWEPLNSGGGLMLVRRHSIAGYETFTDLLGGDPGHRLRHGRSPLELDADMAVAAGRESPITAAGRLFMGAHGRWGRLAETYHLKLRLLAGAAASVRTGVEALGRPLLNLTADGFGVELASPGEGLPALWTARAVLTDPGDAVELPIRASDTQYYIRAGAAGASVYRPVSATAAAEGRAAVRIRQVMEDAAAATVVEGTFTTSERLDVTSNDLIWLRLNLAAGRVDVYARLVKAEALAAGEWRFRTVSQRLASGAVTALKAAEGVPMPDVPFEVVPLMTSPCDLYALGVLGVRTLLVDADTSLPIALDETLSLARQVAGGADAAAPLPERIGALMESDSRWAASIGPARLTDEPVEPDEAFDVIPAELWCRTLAALVRMFPGIGPDSTCADYGDAIVGGLHRVFDQAVDDLGDLLIRTRSLIVVDWRYNRQVHTVLRRHWVGAGGSPEA